MLNGYLSNMEGLLDEYTSRQSPPMRAEKVPFKSKMAHFQESDEDFTKDIQPPVFAVGDSTDDEEEPKRATTGSCSWDRKDSQRETGPFRTRSDDSAEGDHSASVQHLSLSSEEGARTATMKGASTRSENPCSFSTRKSRSQLSPQQVLESRTWSNATNRKTFLEFPASVEEDSEQQALWNSTHSRQPPAVVSQASSTATSSQQAEHNMEDSLDIIGDRESSDRGRTYSTVLHDYTMSPGKQRSSLPRRKHDGKTVKSSYKPTVEPKTLTPESRRPEDSNRKSQSKNRLEVRTCRPKMERAKSMSRKQKNGKDCRPRKIKERGGRSGSFKNEVELEDFNRRVASLALQMIPRNAPEEEQAHEELQSSKSNKKKDHNASSSTKPEHKRKNVGNMLRQRGRCFVQGGKRSSKDGAAAPRAPVPPSAPSSKFGTASKGQSRKKGNKNASSAKSRKSSASTGSSKTKSTETTTVSSIHSQQREVKPDSEAHNQELNTAAKSRVNFKEDFAIGNADSEITPTATPHTQKNKQCGSFHSTIMTAKERTPYNPTGMTPYTPANGPKQEASSSNVKFSRGVPLSEAKKRLHLDDMLSPCLRASRCEGLFEDGGSNEDDDASYQSLSISGDSSSRHSQCSDEPSVEQLAGKREPRARPNKLAGVFEKLQMEDLDGNEENLATIEEDEIDTTGLTQSQLEDSFIRAQLNLSRSKVKQAWGSDCNQLATDEPAGQQENSTTEQSSSQPEELSFEQLQMLDLPYEETEAFRASKWDGSTRTRKVHDKGPLDESQHRILQVHNHARQNRRHELKSILWDGDFGVDSADEDGMTLLLIAAENGYERLAKMLIHDFEADLTCVDNFGNSALHYSLKNGHTKLAEYFRSIGVDDTITNDFGETCYDTLTL